jgi:cysteine desulfurase
MTTPAPIYLDCHATTPLDPRVAAAMRPYWEEQFGNPHSVQHVLGRAAHEGVEAARAAVAKLLGADVREIIFTSGATESNNLAIKGAARFRRDVGGEARDHIITVATEHKCVLESARALAREGFRVTILPVGPDGLLDLQVLAAALDDRVALVSVMAVNNEIGTIQPLAEIARRVHGSGGWLHVDAAQAAGRIALDVVALDIDLLSLSGHKIYGPKGVGALFVRRRPRIRLQPLFDGGGQERGLRSGTLPAPLIVGFGAAADLANEALDAEAERIAMLRDQLLHGLRTCVQEVRVNGAMGAARVAGNLNVALMGVDAEALMRSAPGVCVSSGSACTAASVEPSYVLQALGMDTVQARSSLRFGLGRFTTAVDVDKAVAEIGRAVRALHAAG